MNSVTYILYSEEVDYCVLIDCGEYETLAPVLKSINKKVAAVLLTHGHSDHIYGLQKLIPDYPSLAVYTNEDGHKELHDSRKNLSFYHGYPLTIENYNKKVIQGGETLHFEGLEDIEVMATPGHDTSCLSYKVEKNLFTGDAYIPGIKIFTKFPRGNKELAIQSIAFLSEMENKGYKVYCGHHSYR